MIIQISSGQGPEECELAVGKLYEALKEEFPDMELLSSHVSRNAKSGHSGCYSSILFFTECDLSGLEGTVLWTCKSPFRTNHKRKNWYVDVSVIPEAEAVSCEEEVRFERFHCGGKGGQNVNKVETGVRLIHIATGITVTSTTERSQYLNRKNALVKLNAILRQQERENRQKQADSAWREHTRIVRGNPVRTYEGIEFQRKV
ncbi:MAG: peptide chain release factor H [Acetatifactor sp.]|nr:peptide chain release factor H [Acetatifactor sp.]